MTGSGHHRSSDPFIDEHTVYERHPVEDIEPELSQWDELRDTRLRLLSLLNNFSTCIAEVLARPGAGIADVEIAFWACCFSIGLPICQGQTLTAVATRLNVARATISKAAVAFASSNGLPDSKYLKPEVTRASYADARVESIKRNGHLPRVPRKGRSV